MKKLLLGTLLLMSMSSYAVEIIDLNSATPADPSKGEVFKIARIVSQGLHCGRSGECSSSDAKDEAKYSVKESVQRICREAGASKAKIIKVKVTREKARSTPGYNNMGDDYKATATAQCLF